MALKKFCPHRGCTTLVEFGYCEVHTKNNSQRNKEYDQSIRIKKDKKLTEFYHSKEWDAARLQALIRDHYLCQECLRQKKITPADMVHHTRPIRLHWHLRLDTKYLESLCNSCHSKVDHGG